MNNLTTIKDTDFNVIVSNAEIIESPLEWQRRGLRQTASGYGSKLTTTYKVWFAGCWRRVYATCYSNSASCWFTAKGIKFLID